MGVSIQNPISTFNNAIARKTKFSMVRAFANSQSRVVGKSEEKVKSLVNEFQRDIHSGSTGGINVRI